MQENSLISGTDSFSKNEYMPQLDSLRTFAVLSVLISHWMTKTVIYKILPYGEIGVLLFFVLSGFLISGILFRSRITDEEENKSKVHSLKQFYVRRTLRIFPIYYITIIILFIVNIPTIREYIFYYLFYTCNILYFITETGGGSLSHLWTLSVEEQFYVIWPWIILFIPGKYLLKSIIGIILVGPLFRGIMFCFYPEINTSYINVLTPSCIDSFGLGALLAYFRIYKNQPFTFSSKWSVIFLTINLVVLVVLITLSNYFNNVFPFPLGLIDLVLKRFCFSIVFLFIISRASIGFDGILKVILENKVLVYLGKISYGMYLFHNFIPEIYYEMNFPQFRNIIPKFFFRYLLLVIISSVSWFLIEKPINNLKKYFKYT